MLLGPPDGVSFSQDAEIVLEWQPLAGLPADGYYVIMVVYSHRGETWYDEVPWTQNTQWLASEHEYLLGLSDDGRFVWSVQVVRQTGVDAAGRPKGTEVSPMSDQRTFTWTASGGGGGGNTPEPPPP